MASKSINPRRKMTQAEFLERCRETHGDKYDYSRVVFKNTNSPVTIICPEHGEFSTRAKSHYQGSGCRKCADAAHGAKTAAKLSWTLDDAIRAFRDAHGDRYDYSKVEYKGSKVPVEIICGEHGSFMQTPIVHRQGMGCAACGYASNGDRSRATSDQRLQEFREVHGDKYDYSRAKFRGAHDNIVIVCPEHGEFMQTPHGHRKGGNCPECAKATMGPDRITAVDAAARFAEVFGDRYGLEHVMEDWAGSMSKVRLVCPDHGVFLSWPSNSWSTGAGCPKCGVESRMNVSRTSTSAPEREMRAYIESLGFETEHGYLPDSDNKWTFDVIVPALKVAFEFNGVYWHSYPRARRGQHYYKRKHAEDSGYRMVTIWEDDWSAKRERMESLIRRVLLPAEVRVGARKTEVAKVARDIAAQFHTDYHIQDFKVAVASEHYALFDQDDMVAVASFDKKGVLHRYTIMEGVSILGGLGKVIKAFRGDFGQLPIVTYCDRDHFDGKLYAANGFERVSGTMQMSYVERGRRVRREKYMKHKLPDVLGADISSGTEMEICAEHGIYAAFNSGVDKYVLQAA